MNPTLILAFVVALLLPTSAAFVPVSSSHATHLFCINQDNEEVRSRTTHLADNKRQTSRREALTAALITFTTFASSAQAAVIGAGRCANGEGDGCDSLAEGNAYIQSLQKKSLENKEENKRVRLVHVLDLVYYSATLTNTFSFPSVLLTGGTVLILHEKLPGCICCIRQTNGDEI